jgi:endonuclease-3
MQRTFDFGAGAELNSIRARLEATFGQPHLLFRREPVDQLVKSFISSRTLDAVSAKAHERLVRAYRDWPQLAAADPPDIEALIIDVRFPDKKAAELGPVLRRIGAEHPDYDLTFLGRWSVPMSLSYLQRYRGIGPKIAASTLNFSTLRMPAFVVDTHVSRLLKRLGFVGPTADTLTIYCAVMGVTETWSADDLSEFHALLKHLGQTVCRAIRPNCAACPLHCICKTGRKAFVAA